MKKLITAVVILIVILLAPAAARAQIRQVGSTSSGADAKSTVNFNVGYFWMKSLDGRVDDDVLVNNLLNAHPLLFEIDDFNSATVGAEYLLALGSRFEAGVGVGYTQRTVPTIYEDLVRPGGAEIEQELKLRQVPVSFTGRVLLLPRGSPAEPYFGAGLVAIRYKYSEIGDFVDSNGDIFPERYVADGVAVGPTIFGGIRGLLDRYTVGGEVRWQKAEGKDLAEKGFLGDRLDLGGVTLNFTFGIRF